MSDSEDDKLKDCLIVNDFSDYAVKQFKSQFDALREKNLPVIPVFIDSFGGEIYSLLAMIDIIEASPVPVATIAVGKAMSCGSILLSCGSPGLRFIGPHATVMIHDAATFSIGKLEDIKADVAETERLKNKVFELLAKKCNKPANYFLKIIDEKKNTNWYLDANEAFKHNIVDHIGVPNLTHQFGFELPENLRKGTKTTKKVNKKKK